MQIKIKILPLKTSLFLSAALFLSGCAISNPFIPTDGFTSSTVAIPQTCEPIRSNNMYRATMRPYSVKGITYCPTTVSLGEQFKGTASWYGPNFHGSQTSNGEYYNMYAYTAAHKTLPINTMVKVTNLTNNKTITVRINDRGPFVKNRIIDLSYQAALDIDVVKHGTALVELTILSFDDSATQYAHNKPKVKPITQKKLTTIITSGEFSIQIASFLDKQKAIDFERKCYNSTPNYPTTIKQKKIEDKTIYSVLLGKFKSIEEAKVYMQQNVYNDAFVVRN